MSAVISVTSDPGVVLRKAVLNAGKSLGLTQAEVGEVIGRERSSLRNGLNPDSKAGELALLLVRCYRSLFVLVDGEQSAMRHWLCTFNHHLQAVPREQLNSVAGLLQVTQYLDAMRGKL